jgi:hypothetical protein
VAVEATSALPCRRRLDGEEEDMRTFRWLVVGAAAALLVNAGTATAAPDFTAAEKLCAAQGGEIISEGTNLYTCRLSRFVDLDRGDRAAVQLCESVYRGTFGFSGIIYQCENIPSP